MNFFLVLFLCILPLIEKSEYSYYIQYNHERNDVTAMSLSSSPEIIIDKKSSVSIDGTVYKWVKGNEYVLGKRRVKVYDNFICLIGEGKSVFLISDK
jgi:hypothetical protein